MLLTLGRVSRRCKRVILGAVGPTLAPVTVGIIGVIDMVGGVEVIGMVVGDVYAAVGTISTCSWTDGGDPLYQSRTNVTSVEAPSSKPAIEFRPSSYAAVGGGTVVAVCVCYAAVSPPNRLWKAVDSPLFHPRVIDRTREAGSSLVGASEAVVGTALSV
jgi:hypothetical protein